MPAHDSAPATSAPKSSSARIERTMRVRDIQAILPAAEECMARYGLHCASCGVGGEETFEDGCRMHGMSVNDIDDLLTDLNILLDERPARPETLHITESAAAALRDMLEAEGKANWGLRVGADDGGFAMEFSQEPIEGDKTFAEFDVKLFASPLTLSRIGGATIDLRDGRFKLDVPEDAAKNACACGGKCACESGGSCGCR